MSLPFTLHNVIRLYDKAIANWVGGLPVDYGDLGGHPQPQRGMLWIYSAPEKAIAEMKRVLVRKHWTLPGVKGADDMLPEQWITVPLPFASIARQPPTWDSQRSVIPFKYPKFLRVGNSYRASRFPQPIIISYTIDYWMKKVFTQTWIIEWIRSQISPVGAANNEFFLTVNFGELWGPKLIPIRNIEIIDNSDLAPAEDSDRSLRTTMTFDLWGWLFYPLDDPVPIVFRVITDVLAVDDVDADLPADTTALGDQVIDQDLDMVQEMLDLGEVLILMSDGVSEVGDNTWSIPPTGYIQTVGVPVFGGELVYVKLDMSWAHTLAEGVRIQLFDTNDNPIGDHCVGRGQDAATPVLWVHLDSFTNEVKIRITPSETTNLTLNDLEIRNGTYDLASVDNSFPAGDMKGSDEALWEPSAGSDTLTPRSCGYTTEEAYSGTQSLQVVTAAEYEGVERSISGLTEGIYLVRFRLTGSGNVVELSVLDDVFGSQTTESSILVQPVPTRWDEYVLVVRPVAQTITLRARQRTANPTTFFMDAVTIERVTASWWLSEPPVAV